MRTIISGFLAGICISIAAISFLLCDNRYVSPLLFCIGLISIKELNLNLYTGQVCKIADKGTKHIKKAFFSFCGNFIGVLFSMILTQFSSVYNILQEKSFIIMQSKTENRLISTFIMAVLCNILIFLATYKKDHILTIFSVYIFVFCGMEHSIADLFYIFESSVFNMRGFLFVLTVTAGNACGGILWSYLYKYANKGTKI